MEQLCSVKLLSNGSTAKNPLARSQTTPLSSFKPQEGLSEKLQISVTQNGINSGGNVSNSAQSKPKVSLMGKSKKSTSRLGSLKLGLKLDVQSVKSDATSVANGPNTNSCESEK